ncbi:NAD-dependent epimerase/dehydratase family protein [Aeromonas salmonicida]|jgi:nucleoside-diphosphate-sugar epimerase|uniref:NAD-dependent epimerase/dehydratase family protein n=1 Tax=Aeromonas salmonicida TaxID=645 RepID=UPI00232C1629|nr:NAD(P)-dependent oxidoreductase [Aeromonas salmonicida]WCH22657.1 NAD(P)-dependent oxidoreductase [Aeromonas salmonicida]
MKCIVLGGRSMLGLKLRQLLEARGHQVWLVGRGQDDDFWLELGASRDIELPAGFKADVLFHCAASFSDDSLEGIGQNISVNVAACHQVLELARAAGIFALVYAGTIGSDFELLEAGQQPNSYTLSKAQAEQWLQMGMRLQGGSFCSVRLTQLWDDEGLCCVHQPWVGRIIAYASRGMDLNMPVSLGPRNFLHVEDAATLMLLAAENRLSGIYPACAQVSIDMFTLALRAFSLFNAGGKVTLDSSKKPFRHVKFSEDFTLYKRLGYFPKIAILDDISRIKSAKTAPAFGPMDVS